MNLPNESGRYVGKPVQWTVAEQGTNRLLTFVCEFDLLSFYQDEQWIDVTGHALSITGYF